MKKTLTILLAAFVLILFAACNNSGQNESAEDASSVTDASVDPDNSQDPAESSQEPENSDDASSDDNSDVNTETSRTEYVISPHNTSDNDPGNESEESDAYVTLSSSLASLGVKSEKNKSLVFYVSDDGESAVIYVFVNSKDLTYSNKSVYLFYSSAKEYRNAKKLYPGDGHDNAHHLILAERGTDDAIGDFRSSFAAVIMEAEIYE